jgi:heptosyltransferase-2
MKILVIRFTSMGDVILATSLFSFLKKNYPDSHIFFLTDVRYSGIFKDDSRLDSVIGAEKAQEMGDCRELFGMQWDMVIDLQNNKRSFQVKKRLSSAHAPYVFNKRYPKRFLLLTTRLNFYSPDDHVALRYIETAGVEKGTLPVAPPPRVCISETDSKRLLEAVFTDGTAKPLLALIPFSAWKNKEWMREYFIVVGRYFFAKGWRVVVLGGPEEEREALDMKMKIGPDCKSLAGRLSLYECACILKESSLALGNDTGLSHLSRACGVKAGVIFGSTTWQFGFFPFGDPPYKVFQTDFFCRPCHPHGGNICFMGNRPCLRRITPESVIAGLEDLYGESPHSWQEQRERADGLKR